MLKEYFSYLKNNPQELWFKRKLYGWGWVPVRWQGWLVVGIFIAFLVWNSFSIDAGIEPVPQDFFFFFGKTLIAVLLLLFVCYKTGEKPRWQWGKERE
jgi:hypothetical protein